MNCGNETINFLQPTDEDEVDENQTEASTDKDDTDALSLIVDRSGQSQKVCKHYSSI